MEPNHGRIVFSLMPKVMDADIRGVLIALIIVIVVFAVGTAVFPAVRGWPKVHGVLAKVHG